MANNITKFIKEATVDAVTFFGYRLNCNKCPATKFCDSKPNTTCEETFRDWALMEEE